MTTGHQPCTMLLTVDLHQEQDVVKARQYAREVAAELGFDRQDQTRITTAVSEIARNAYEYAHGGNVEFAVLGTPPQTLLIRVADNGLGISRLQEVLDGSYVSPTGMGLGLVGARRLSDRFRIDSSPGQGTRIELEKDLPRRRLGEAPIDLSRLIQDLRGQSPQNPYEEINNQNRELIQTLDTLNVRQSELEELNGELEDTNRGVMALYAELDENAKELQRASEMKTRFLSDMSHEFRTPLNSIMGLARLLLERADGPLTSEQEKQVTFLYRSARQLSEIVNDLLDTAKIEAGKVTIQVQEFTVEDLFRSLRGVFRPLIGDSSDVTLVFEDTDSLPLLHTDEGKVTQILRNFISNALKFTERGTVTVQALYGPNDTLVFSVQDTGIGIAPEDISRIFEEFAQVEGTIQQRRSKGTGLGLPLSRRLAMLLGGQISVTSEVGLGSTFTLALPLYYTEPDMEDIHVLI